MFFKLLDSAIIGDSSSDYAVSVSVFAKILFCINNSSVVTVQQLSCRLFGYQQNRKSRCSPRSKHSYFDELKCLEVKDCYEE